MKRRLVAFLGWAALAAPVAGQDSHYWTSQFGNRARLLGGSVVGSATDLSGIYYNPGALALVPKPELLLSGTVFQYERVGVANALGPNSNIADSRFAMVPSLFAGEIHFDALGENRVGYAFLTRQDAEFRINERADITDRLQAALPGLEFASTGVQYESRLREYWVGGSWSRKISERIGFGVSPFVAVRNQRARSQSLTQALGQAGGGGIALSNQSYDYYHWRLLLKAGVSTDWEEWKLGFTVTTPSLGLFGSGDSGLDLSAIGQDVDQDGRTATSITSDFQEGISADYTLPSRLPSGPPRASAGAESTSAPSGSMASARGRFSNRSPSFPRARGRRSPTTPSTSSIPS